MTYFPPINSSGTLVQLPYKRGQNFSNVVQGNPTGRPYSYAMIGGGLQNFPNNPLGSFALTYSTLTDAERAVVKNFVENVAVGALNTFSYIDPNGNLVTASENFSDASWTVSGATIGSAVQDPFGGTLATSLAGTTTNVSLATTVIPTGSVAGFYFNISIWVKAAASQTLELAFLDASNTVLASTVWKIPAAAWKRIYLPYACATTGALKVQIGGSGTWNSTTLSLFAAQCVSTPGPGPYLRAPGSVGLHAKCRLDVDSFPWKFIEAGSTGVVIPIQEIF